MNAFHAWLRTSEGAEVISRCVGIQTHNDGDDDQPSFWEFLLQTQGRGSATLHALVTRQDWEGLRRKIKSMHALFVAEQKRDLLYQRVRQVLHDADATFGYQAGDKFSWYGATDPAATHAWTYDELRASGFAPVCPILDTDAVRSAAGVLVLAASFREQLAAHRGYDCRISIQSLCAFIRDNFEHVYDQDTARPAKAQITLDHEGREPVAHENIQSLPTTAERFIGEDTRRAASNDWHSEETLEQLANAVAYQLERERLLLLVCLLTYCGLTMAQTAKAMGYAGPSGVSAPYHKAQLLIKEATSLVDGMGEDDLNDDMFRHFLGLLLGACKDGDCSRYAR